MDHIHQVQQSLGGSTPSSAGMTQSPTTMKHHPITTTPHPVLNSNAVMQARPVMMKSGMPQYIDTELLIKTSTAPKKSPHHVEEDKPKEPEIVQLRNAYLSFNGWCSQFKEVGIELDQLTEGPLAVQSSHQISFRQFTHRFIRKLKSPELESQFDEYTQSFERMRSAGVDLSLPSPEPEEFKGFHYPPESEYRRFNDWLSWLQELDINPADYSSVPLEVESSHRISFPQFCRRLERKLDDAESFRKRLA